MHIKQRTLKTSISCCGIALHSGHKVAMTLCPADVDSGIIFRRTDISGGGAVIPARWDHVVDTRLNTTLGNQDGIIISTVEHLMAALAGCGIDNLEIEINGAEVPVMDGSASPFVFLVQCAGIEEQPAPRRVLEIRKPLTVHDDKGASATLLPNREFLVDFTIDYPGTVIDRQEVHASVTNDVLTADFARARTFGFLSEVEQMRAAGLARGGSLDNAVVLSSDGILNQDGLRYRDEFVRHKVLDAVGDLYLAGGPMRGHFSGHCSGHGLNNRLLRSLFADADAWRWTTQDAETPVTGFVRPGGSHGVRKIAVAAPL